jgi:hypothetical protein
MSVNFNKQVQPPPVVANKVAMPVGTSIIMAMDKFMFDKRDLNCTACRNGYRSTLPKMLDGKMYSVSVICTCVPYYQQSDSEGTGVVIYKGRRESWIKGVRPESEIQNEMLREGADKNAFKNKLNPQAPLQNPDGKNVKANLQKALENENKPKQKVMQQDKAGHFLFVDLETGKKMGLTVSDVSNPTVNPDSPEKVKQVPQTPPPQQQANGYKGLRPESDEEFLERTTGEKPMTADPRVISADEAAKIEAAKTVAPVNTATAPPTLKADPTPSSVSVTVKTPTPTPEVKRGRGRPKGSGKK